MAVPETSNVKFGEKDENLPAVEYTFVGKCQSKKMEEFANTYQLVTGTIR